MCDLPSVPNTNLLSSSVDICLCKHSSVTLASSPVGHSGVEVFEGSSPGLTASLHLKWSLCLRSYRY